MEESKNICLNCNYTVEDGYPYCKNCGQKSIKNLLSFQELVSSAFATIGNLDGPFYKSIGLILKPWKLTVNYINGKRKPYLHPSRLFILILVAHFALLLSIIDIDNKKLRSLEHYGELEKSQLFEKFLSIQSENPELITKRVQDTITNQLFKSVELPENDIMDMNTTLGSYNFKITRSDAIELSNDSLFRKYNITSFTDKLVVSQLIKVDLDRAGSLRYLIKNFGWSTLIIVLLLALFFKLLYFKTNKYFVEHLIFWLNVHSSAFFIMIVGIIVYKLFETEYIYIFPIMVTLQIFLSMYVYYKQSIVRTFFKFCFTGFFYLTVCILIGALFSVVSLLLY
jgi:hypothetical protein